MRVALIFPGALGDFLLAAPAFAALERDGAQVELSVTRVLAPLARAMFAGPFGPPADSVAMSSLFAGTPAEAIRQWLAGVDVVHAWCGAQTALAVAVGGLGVGEFQAHAVERGPGRLHASEGYARALGVQGPLSMPTVALPVPHDALWTRPPAVRLVVHPGAGSSAKRWSFAGFAAVADGWVARGGEVIVLLGPAETDIAPEWRRSQHRTTADLSLLEVVALLASASSYVGNDSGVSHLAGALRLSGVVLFSPTPAERWRPLGGALVPLAFTDRPDGDVAADVLGMIGSVG
jgi:hypothetical protein